ncbi:MAG: hypothetical protein LWW97_12535 [Deltaproteobacteria bacterium]|nr:hypothetical protein [Deltaproteobacteria bacterium]
MGFDDISYNFSIAKVLSIFMVATGHYFGGILWIPTSFALFIFAFSSGFFTSRKYQHPFSKKKFWYAKIVRMCYPILIIDIFLFFFFLLQQKSGIFSWQTLPSMIGINGFLTWFNLANPSPFGAGLWFFTLLLLFYFFYPLLSLFNKKHPIAIAFLLASLLVTTILHYMMPMGHMLWMAAFAFILGNYSGVHGCDISPWICVFLTTISCLLLLSLNTVIDYNQLNDILIIVACISIIGYLLNKRLPNFIINKLLLLSGCVIQIYFIHTYLFVKLITKQPIINYLISMFVIITIAFLLSKISDKLSSLNVRKV